MKKIPPIMVSPSGDDDITTVPGQSINITCYSAEPVEWRLELGRERDAYHQIDVRNVY